ncbi:MAG TPA: hypothetical protein DD727_04270, partial [Clostridiales bacterium]|nr:hypothetical protein [Clostridiales bacterium]
ENLLTPAAALEQLSPELLRQVESKYDPIRIPYGMVTGGQPFARIARGLDYYLIAGFTGQEASRLTRGNRYTVKFNGLDTQVEAEVVNSIPAEAGKTYVVLRTDQAMAKTVSLRKIGIEIVLGDYTGLKIPLSGLRDLDIQAGIARLGMVDAYKAKFVDVEVVGMNAEYAIIRSPDDAGADRIYLYCIYVSDPFRVEDGQDVDPR